MRFKKTKEDVLNELKWNAKAVISNQFYHQPDLSRENLAFVMAMGIEEAFRTLLDNQYTDEDFERDMNLK
jgi:hypothetical protein